MVLILKLFLWIFLLGLCMVAYFALRIFLTVRKAKKEFEAMTGGKGGQGANGSQGANGGFGSGNGPAGQTTTTSHGDQITDTRNPEKAHRKAISDDEGEYIDFVEED